MDELVTSTEGVGQKLSQFVASTRAAIVDDKLKKLVRGRAGVGGSGG